MSGEGAGPVVHASLAQRPDYTWAQMLSARFGDWLFKTTTLLFALLIGGLVLLIILSMAQNSALPFAKFGPAFLWRSIWDPVHQDYGALPVIYGTIVSSIIALLIAVPV